jgi:hypothetical protein
MDDVSRRMRLLAWALASFHTAFFFLLFVILTYLSGNLGQLLSSLNTLAGVAIFALLWLTTTFCTGHVVLSIEPATLEHPFASFDVIKRVTVKSAFWGGVNGFIFLIGLLVILAFVFITALIPVLFSSQVIGLVSSVGFFTSIASVIALILGGIVGIVFSMLDFVILGIACLAYKLIELESGHNNLRVT